MLHRPAGSGLGGLVYQEAQIFLRDAPEVTSEDSQLRASLRLPAGTPHFPGVPHIPVSELPLAVSSLAWGARAQLCPLRPTAGLGTCVMVPGLTWPSQGPAPSVHPLRSLQEA